MVEKAKDSTTSKVLGKKDRTVFLIEVSVKKEERAKACLELLYAVQNYDSAKSGHGQNY